MKVLSLRPFAGKVLVCKNKKEYKQEHLELFGETISLKGKFGRVDGHENGTYLVWATGKPNLAHEFAHVLFTLFDKCGINPADSQGEAFCYMLAQLLLDAED